MFNIFGVFLYMFGFVISIKKSATLLASNLDLYSNPICPFAHRSWLALEELGLTYKYVFVCICSNALYSHVFISTVKIHVFTQPQHNIPIFNARSTIYTIFLLFTVSLSDMPAWYTPIYSKALGAEAGSSGQVPTSS